MIEFKPCPDCGSQEYPSFYRENYYSGYQLAGTHVKAVCKTCEWETSFCCTVKGCADEWNENILREVEE